MTFGPSASQVSGGSLGMPTILRLPPPSPGTAAGELVVAILERFDDLVATDPRLREPGVRHHLRFVLEEGGWPEEADLPPQVRAWGRRHGVLVQRDTALADAGRVHLDAGILPDEMDPEEVLETVALHIGPVRGAIWVGDGTMRVMLHHNGRLMPPLEANRVAGELGEPLEESVHRDARILAQTLRRIGRALRAPSAKDQELVLPVGRLGIATIRMIDQQVRLEMLDGRNLSVADVDPAHGQDVIGFLRSLFAPLTTGLRRMGHLLGCGGPAVYAAIAADGQGSLHQLEVIAWDAAQVGALLERRGYEPLEARPITGVMGTRVLS